MPQPRACEWVVRGARAGRPRARHALTFTMRPVGEPQLARAPDDVVAPTRTLKRPRSLTSRHFFPRQTHRTVPSSPLMMSRPPRETLRLQSWSSCSRGVSKDYLQSRRYTVRDGKRMNFVKTVLRIKRFIQSSSAKTRAAMPFRWESSICTSRGAAPNGLLAQDELQLDGIEVSECDSSTAFKLSRSARAEWASMATRRPPPISHTQLFPKGAAPGLSRGGTFYGWVSKLKTAHFPKPSVRFITVCIALGMAFYILVAYISYLML